MTERDKRVLSDKQLAHNRRIAPLGYQATLTRHFNGDRSAMGLWLFRKCMEKYDPAPWNGAWQQPPLTPIFDRTNTLKDEEEPF